MKKIIKISLFVLVIAMTLSLFGCKAFERTFLGADPFSFSDIVMTQTGVNEYKIDFTVDCGNKDVTIYFTEGSRLSDKVLPKAVDKTVDGKNARFSFTEELILGENYYLWVVQGDKQAKISIPAPSMFPGLTVNEDGSAIFNFNYTYDTAWGAFCDPNGKAVYKSQSPVFDDSAVKLCDQIEITDEEGEITAEQFDPTCYYYSVTTGKEGNLTVISRPVTVYDQLIGQIKSISATITNDLMLKVDLTIPDGGAFSSLVAEKLQLLVKTSAADELYVIDCKYESGVATMTFDCTKLIFDGLWYDVVMIWDGVVVMDVPKTFNGQNVVVSSVVKKDGILYNIVDWKPDDAPDSAAMLKVYFEEDTTRFADEILKSYLVSFSTDPVPTLNVTVKLKDGVSAPTLAITGGDKTILASANGVLNDDGSYSYSLAVGDGLTEADKWYDLRFFVGTTAYEMLKDSCITYSDFAAKYSSASDSREYQFREWNGFLKLMYIDLEA